MSTLVSPKVAALRAKLRQAEHGGQYFSSDDVAGILRELSAISDGTKALEDEIVRLRRSQPAAAPTPKPAPLPIGTIYFVPAGPQASMGGRA